MILNRSRRRAPNLTATDRIVIGLCTLFMNLGRIRKVAAALKPTTLLGFHRALKERKYRRLFSPQRRGKPGPKGPSKELIQAIVEMEATEPPLRVPEDCTAALEGVWYRDRQGRGEAGSCEVLLATARRRRSVLAGVHRPRKR